jgi:hypothetical protein
MTKKIIFIAFLALIILAGFLFLTPPAKTLTNHDDIRSTAPLSSDVTTNSLSGSRGAEGPKPASSVRPTIASEKYLLAKEVSSRSTRWRNAKSAWSITTQIEQLLINGDLESPRFAYSLFRLCEQANEQKSSEQVPEEAVRFRLKEYENGKPHTAPVTPEEWRMTLAIVDSRHSKNTVMKKRALSDSFAARCGGSMSDKLGLKIVNANENSIKAGSLLSNAPYGDLRSDSSFVALEKVLRDPSLASVWLPIKRDFLDDAAKRAGYFEGLNNDDQKALVWMVICNFGGDCDDDGITRLDACLSSHLCDGNSAAESVANAVGKDKVLIIAARANKLSLDLAAVGANFFKPRSK